MYKPNISHVIVDVLSKLPNITKPTCVPNPTRDASLFYTKPKWLKDVNFFENMTN
jgi:hypothetical protein